MTRIRPTTPCLAAAYPMEPANGEREAHQPHRPN